MSRQASVFYSINKEVEGDSGEMWAAGGGSTSQERKALNFGEVL